MNSYITNDTNIMSSNINNNILNSTNNIISNSTNNNISSSTNNNITSSIRIKWIDGLKGIACILIYLHHFISTFYPAYNTGNSSDTRLFNIDCLLCNSPLGIIINGNFWVNVFLAISAFVLSIQMLRTDSNNLRSKAGTILIRRYPRLMIPMLSTGIINWLILFFVEKFNFSYVNLRNESSLLKTIWIYGVSTWIHADANVFGQLWTMHYLFMTAIVVVFFTVFDKKENKYTPFLYLIMTYPMLTINECYLSIVFGILLSDIVFFNRIEDAIRNEKLNSLWKNPVFQKILSVMLLIFAIYFGGYPSNTTPIGLYSLFLKLDNHFPFFSGYMHAFGAFLLLEALFLWKKSPLKINILESRLFQILGKYSLAVYMTHGFFIIYFCSFMYFSLAEFIANYNFTVLIVFLICSLLIGICSFIFNRTIEKFTNFICRKINI